jgi:hypothetical protein
LLAVPPNRRGNKSHLFLYTARIRHLHCLTGTGMTKSLIHSSRPHGQRTGGSS